MLKKVEKGGEAEERHLEKAALGLFGKVFSGGKVNCKSAGEGKNKKGR